MVISRSSERFEEVRGETRDEEKGEIETEVIGRAEGGGRTGLGSWQALFQYGSDEERGRVEEREEAEGRAEGSAQELLEGSGAVPPDS